MDRWINKAVDCDKLKYSATTTLLPIEESKTEIYFNQTCMNTNMNSNFILFSCLFSFFVVAFAAFYLIHCIIKRRRTGEQNNNNEE